MVENVVGKSAIATFDLEQIIVLISTSDADLVTNNSDSRVSIGGFDGRQPSSIMHHPIMTAIRRATSHHS